MHMYKNGSYDVDCSNHVNLKDPKRDLRSDNDTIFKCEHNFFFRAGALVNRLPRSVKFRDGAGLKKQILYCCCCCCWGFTALLLGFLVPASSLKQCPLVSARDTITE